MPNFMPIYGRRICIEYKGNKKQCTWCYGFHLRKYCKNERMNIEEYATRFRLQHPKIPEQYYGKFAKMENINKQSTLVYPDLDNVTSTANTSAPTTTKEPADLNPKGQVPKLSLRRDSVPGSSWVNVNSATAVVPAANSKNIVSNKSDKPESRVERALPADPKVVQELSSLAQSTRIVTGNAVSSLNLTLNMTY